MKVEDVEGKRRKIGGTQGILIFPGDQKVPETNLHHYHGSDVKTS